MSVQPQPQPGSLEPSNVDIFPQSLFPELPARVPPPDAAPAASFPPPVADYGPCQLELMGHRYREGRLAEVVIAGAPFLQLTTADGEVEIYAPTSVYCITPGLRPPRPAIPSGWREHDEDEDLDDDDEAPF